MSVSILNLPFQTGPRIWIENDCLCAKTSFLSRILNCFSCSRTVTIDQKRKIIKIETKTFWFLNSTKTIPFDDLKFIDISHSEVSSDFSTIPEGYVSDVYYVRLITKSDHIPTTLFRFIVSGGKYIGIGGGRPADWEGLQMEKVLQYAKQVSKFTEIPLWENRNIEFSFNIDHQFECPKCGHRTNTVINRCMYCGFKVNKDLG